MINVENYHELRYQIMGSDCQALQLVLMPGQVIVTAANSVQYMSEGIKMSNKYIFRERVK